MNRDQIISNLIVKHVAGSKAYGTSTASSDQDYRGIFSAPPEYTRTPFFDIKTYEDPAEEDTVLFELNQFFYLTARANPNVVETLWVDMSDVVVNTEAYQHIRGWRGAFLSKRFYHTTLGYARSEMDKVKKKYEETGEFNAKNAMHVVRLVRMGREVFTHGEIFVKRPDAAELKSIRNGEWSIDRLQQYVVEQEEELRRLKDTSTLPNEPNKKLLASILMEAQDRVWHYR